MTSRTTPLLSAGILAGGASRRMGFPKSELRLPNGQFLLETLIQKLSSQVEEILIAVEPKKTLPFPLPAQVRLVEDKDAYEGPLAGLCTLLEKATNPFLFLTACDMPNLSLPVLQALYQKAYQTGNVVLPQSEDGPVSLFGIFPLTFRALILKQKETHRSLKSLEAVLPISWFPEECWRPLDPEGAFLKNLNTPKEYQLFFETDQEKVPGSPNTL